MRKVYTDGSAYGKRIGWAFVAQSSRSGEACVVKSGADDGTDAYDAELLAVCNALEMCEGDICIVSDHWGIVKILRDMFDGGYDRPHKGGKLWERIEAQADKLKGVEWMKRMKTHEQRVADHLAGYEARAK